ncbi:MAG: V-type ATP synthase subunit E [Clostridiales bacterium]|nr:V-type ATP synthase subunit E [Clostridiales bacterium]
MNGIDRISQRILDDAQAKAAQIIEEARQRARSIKDKKTEEAEKNNQKIHKNNKAKAQERRQRMLGAAELEMRKEVLASKQQMIDEVMEKTKEAIMDMPRGEYGKIVSNMLLESAQGHEEVIFSVSDEGRLDQSLIDKVNKMLKGQGKRGELKLAPERGEFDGGFILRSGGMEINNTFGAILRMNRNHLEARLAEILFGKEG